MAPASLKVFLRSQEAGAAVGNAVCNLLLGWILHRDMAPVPVAGPGGILVDTAITSVLASAIITLLAAPAVRKAWKAAPPGAAVDVTAPPALLRLPRSPGLLGLTLGAGMAVAWVALLATSFRLLGLSAVPAAWFLALKAAYTGALGFLVARWAVMRLLVVHDRG